MKLYANKFGEHSVIGCALSGIAAKRIENVTGYKSLTIHTLLGYRGGNDFEYNENNKLDYSLIMNDEASMIDTYLFHKLLKAVDSENTILLIVRDPAQLKAFAPRNIFEDIVNSKDSDYKYFLLLIILEYCIIIFALCQFFYKVE